MTPATTEVRLAEPWDHELERQVLLRLSSQLGLALPDQAPEKRLPVTDEERDLYYHHWSRVAALDFYIFESCAAGITLSPDPEAKLFLTRQIGDDGEHARLFRERITAVTGRDPIDHIERYRRRQWEVMGRLSTQDWLGFLAFEVHYELYVVPTLFLSAYLDGHIADPVLIQLGADRFLPDEALHRRNVVGWWRRHLERLPAPDRRAVVGELQALDDEAQRRRAADLRLGWELSARAAGAHDPGFEPLYHAWRAEVQEFLYAA